MKKISVSIADDHVMVIRGLKAMLEESSDMEIMDAFTNGSLLLEGLRVRQPDVLLLDITMPGIKGYDLALQISEQWPSVGIIALTNSDQTYDIQQMIRNGALGYLLKNVDQRILLDAIRSVCSGIQFIDPNLKDQLLRDVLSQRKKNADMPVLTERELDVLRLIGENNTSQEIASKLFLSKHTIDHYRISLLAKFEVKNASGLVRKAIDLGIIE